MEERPKPGLNHSLPQLAAQGTKHRALAQSSRSEMVANLLERYPGKESPAVVRQSLALDCLTGLNHPQQLRPRALTPAADRANWECSPRPIAGDFLKARPRSMRNQDRMGSPEAGWQFELQRRDHSTPPECMIIQTCEPEGRDAFSALQALKQDHLATEERRLDELIQAEDRMRELEHQNDILMGTIREMVYLEKFTRARLNRFRFHSKQWGRLNASYQRSSNRPVGRRQGLRRPYGRQMISAR